MYYSITGKVIFYEEGKVVLENNGIAYELGVSSNTLSAFAKKGEIVTAYTYLKVAEDEMSLYGFFSKEEKAMFINLISVSGVGPKTALQILSGIDLQRLAIAIVNSDSKTLSKVKGLGKKTAERIILELKEKIAEVGGGDDGDGFFGLLGGDDTSKDEVVNDAVLALVSLGISKTEAVKAVAVARGKSDKLENIITLALRSFDK
ncbi:MAG: Holliday junction branch migration protein RuvA [Clostridia bacterium]|nr:Holliday junction branch migration protein RuvA [Clostridia bacterium]MDE7348188.1 Holliday junction branch migration protein RuvA [Clostridia bacterium]